MNALRRGRRAVGFALIVVAGLLSVGCAEELGPVSMPVTRVRGVVKEGDLPVAGGWIEFIPADGTVGNLRSARIRADGTFDTDGVAVGKNAIRVVDAPIASPSDVPLFARLGWASLVRTEGGRLGTKAPALLFIPFASPIRRDIGTGDPAPVTIDVVEEALQFQKDRSRAGARKAAAAAEGP
jgi:hypothetical protein